MITEEKDKNTASKENRVLNWVIETLIGTREQRNTAIKALKNLPEEFKDPKRAVYLIFIGAICFSITFFGVQLLRNVQNDALYCRMYTVQESDAYRVKEPKWGFGSDSTGNLTFNQTIEIKKVLAEGALPMPEGEHTYAWFLDYYKDGKKYPWQGFNCTLSFKRWYNERF